MAAVPSSDTRGNSACTSGRRTKSRSILANRHGARPVRRPWQLHAELRFESGLRPAVAQHQELRPAGRDMNALDLPGLRSWRWTRSSAASMERCVA